MLERAFIRGRFEIVAVYKQYFIVLLLIVGENKTPDAPRGKVGQGVDKTGDKQRRGNHTAQDTGKNQASKSDMAITTHATAIV